MESINRLSTTALESTGIAAEPPGVAHRSLRSPFSVLAEGRMRLWTVRDTSRIQSAYRPTNLPGSLPTAAKAAVMAASAIR